MTKPPKRINRRIDKRKYYQKNYKRDIDMETAMDEGEGEPYLKAAGEDRWEYNLGDGCKRIVPHHSNYS